MSERERFPIRVYRHPNDGALTVRLTFLVPRETTYKISIALSRAKAKIGLPFQPSPEAPLCPFVQFEPRFEGASLERGGRLMSLEMAVTRWQREQRVAVVHEEQVVVLLDFSLDKQEVFVLAYPSSPFEFKGAYPQDERPAETSR